MNKEIENLISKTTLRDVEIKILERVRDGITISREVMKDILTEVESELTYD